MGQQRLEADFFNKVIIISDEAHFYLDGFVNQQNYSIYDSKNPQVIVKKLKIFLFGANFELEATGQRITINGTLCRDVIIQCFVTKLQNMDCRKNLSVKYLLYLENFGKKMLNLFQEMSRATTYISENY